MRERTLTTAFAVACALLSLCGDRCGAAPRGYLARPCGFDMNRNGIIGEAADRLVADGVSADPDGDGVNEDILYVDSAAGSDTTGSGTAGNPYRTIQKALDVADGPADGAEDIICISGVFREQLTLKQSGVAGYYTRDGFQFPRNKRATPLSTAPDEVCCRIGCGDEAAKTFHHESYTNACAVHGEEIRPWVGDGL